MCVCVCVYLTSEITYISSVFQMNRELTGFFADVDFSQCYFQKVISQNQ